ncbi:uncharacterized protein LOC124370522 [Homalodisca vitripennis]|uniref:uncharacterized protein LOC124370522 n=1 Tax=Homalodisca vitripennis TaxID=197043 RepID=UPI001EECF2AE|nr:uncharacterized protein LOC124370522 [Homalodisca vitripennis]
MPDNTEKTSNVKTRNMSKSSEDNEPTLQSLDKKLNTIISAIEANSTVIKVIQQEQVDLASSVELCHNNIKDLSESIKKQDARVDMCVSEVDGVKNENIKLNVRDLERKLNDLEQYSHRNNLVVYGIPEVKNEVVLNVIKRLAMAINFKDWSTNLVDAAHRMGTLGEDGERPIIIKFISRLDKDEFLQKRKAKKHLRAADFGYASESSIYVNESLTSPNRKLLQKTREAARKKGYQYVWTLNCSIYVRKATNDKAVKILTEASLDGL